MLVIEVGGSLDLKYFWLTIKPIVNTANGGISERISPPIPANLRPLSTSTILLYNRVIAARSPQIMKPFKITQIINVHVCLLQPLKLYIRTAVNAMAIAIVDKSSITTPRV